MTEPLITEAQLWAVVLALLIGVVLASIVATGDPLRRAVCRFVRERMHRRDDPWCAWWNGAPLTAHDAPCCLVCANMDDLTYDRAKAIRARRNRRRVVA